MFLASSRSIIDNIIRAHSLSSEDWGPSREVTLPGFSMSIGGMVDALRNVAGDVVASRVNWEPDAFIQKIVDGWPPEFDTKKALALGFTRDSSMEEVINAFNEDELSGSIMKK